MRLITLILLSTLLTVVLVLVACGSSPQQIAATPGGQSTQNSATNTQATNQSNLTNEATIQKLLKLMPASVMQNDMSIITINDYAKMRQIYGIPLPASDSQEDITNYMRSLFAAKIGISNVSFISGMDRFALTGPIKKINVGFSLQNVDAEIKTGFPPTIIEVTSGTFNPSATKDAFSKQDKWPAFAKEKFASEVYKNVTIYSWGNGNEQHLSDRLVAPNIDELGRARPLTVTPNNVFCSNSVEYIKLMIDSGSDQTTGLINLPAYSDIAKGLDNVNVYLVTIAKDTIQPKLSLMNDTSQSPLLKKYLAYATGIGKDEKGKFLVILIANEDAKTTADNLKILQTRIEKVPVTISNKDSTPEQQIWRKFFSDVQVTSTGNLITAKLYIQNEEFGGGLGLGGYPILAHE